MAFWGITSRNDGQKVALQALDSDKPYIFITGPAGGGKTLLAQAVGLHRVVESQTFDSMIYTRLQIQVGMNLGALPGDLNEKNYPFIAPFLDNLNRMSGNASNGKNTISYLISGDEKKRKVFFDSIQTIRGRSLYRRYVIVDEAQNLDVSTIHAIATRLDEGTKIIFLGNFAQVDTAKLRHPKNNGLYTFLNGLYEKQEYKYFEHVNLTECERHPAVNVAESILRDYDMNPKFEELEQRGNVV